MTRTRVLAALAGTVVALGAGAAAAPAQDPPLVNLPTALPALAVGFTPDTFGTCPDGSPACLQDTLAEMRERLAAYDAACDHRALFLRNYLTITEHFEQLPASFFEDPVFLAREDAIFADLYFAALDAYDAGRPVPEAWRIAISAAAGKRVEGAGDLLLGINAHVQRDMPFMLAGMGLVSPDGRSRKPDHDRMNAVLNAAYDDVYRRATAMDDPRLALYDPPGVLDGFAAVQMVHGWREGVWRNAERLVRARTTAERAQVAASIEAYAASWARFIEAATTYRSAADREARQAHCRSARTDPGPGSPPKDLDGRALVAAGPLRLRLPG